MIILGADHAGFELKETLKNYLQELNEDILDVGAYKVDSEDDFSTFVKLMAKSFKDYPDSQIIAVCGSGVGMNIGLNKQKGVFCCLGHNVEEVVKSREHNNINALALGGRTTEVENAKQMVKAFLTTKHLGGKYTKRMTDIDL